MQSGHGNQIWTGEIVGNARRAQRYRRAIADAVRECKQRQRDETRLYRPNEKQRAQRDMERAQCPLAPEPVGHGGYHPADSGPHDRR